MRRTRPPGQKRTHKVVAAEAAMLVGFAELYAAHGDNFTAADVEEMSRTHGMPMGLAPEEFAEASMAFLSFDYRVGAN